MKTSRLSLSASALLLPAVFFTANLHAQPAKVTLGHSRDNNAFETETTRPPAVNDAAAEAEFKLIAGKADPNSGPLTVLNDGKIPGGEDEPPANFFLSGDSDGGRILVDLGAAKELASIASYSWHAGSRAGQNYLVYAASGAGDAFDVEAADEGDLAEKGWTLLASVDSTDQRPGQHAVEVAPEEGESLGSYRYVLFDIKKNAREARFNDTFFSEIDIVAADGPELVRVEKPKRITEEFESKFGDYRYTLDVTEAPDLQEWAAKNLIPVMDEWYPKIIEMLPVDGIKPAKDITFTIKEATNLPSRLRGVPAYASGNSVVFNAGFMRDQLTGEAIGAGVHEVVHVVQFGGTREDGRRARANRRPPSWVTEGVADYIRWFLYEPESKGAEITERNFERANYDSSYRITGNFFDWVIKNHEPDLMRKLNVATHEGYTDDLWKEWTGKTVQELGDEWKAYHRERLGIEG